MRLHSGSIPCHIDLIKTYNFSVPGFILNSFIFPLVIAFSLSVRLDTGLAELKFYVNLSFVRKLKVLMKCLDSGKLVEGIFHQKQSSYKQSLVVQCIYVRRGYIHSNMQYFRSFPGIHAFKFTKKSDSLEIKTLIKRAFRFKTDRPRLGSGDVNS